MDATDIAKTNIAGADVEVVYDSVSEELAGAIAGGIRYQGRPGRLLLKVDGVARFLVCDGRRIIIDRAALADDDDVRVFLLGSALGALLHQRNAIVLHGSAVIINGTAVAFVGPSGIGKSTLAAAFRQRGAVVLTDDMCVLWPDDSGQMHVHPGLPEAKLWIDSLQRLDIAASELQQIRRTLEKRALPLGAAFASSPAPLKHIYVLRSAASAGISIVKLHGPQVFAALKNQTYRVQFLEGLGTRTAHFRNMLSLAQQVSISSVIRPRGAFLLEALLQAISADLQA